MKASAPERNASPAVTVTTLAPASRSSRCSDVVIASPFVPNTSQVCPRPALARAANLGVASVQSSTTNVGVSAFPGAKSRRPEIERAVKPWISINTSPASFSTTKSLTIEVSSVSTGRQ